MSDWKKPENIFSPKTPMPTGPDERAIARMDRELNATRAALKAFVDWHCVEGEPKLYVRLDTLIENAKRLLAFQVREGM